jgi:hypothetical protein
LTVLTTGLIAQKSDCCDTLLKIITGKQVHKTTCVKRPIKTPNQDIIISIDNSHSANNTTQQPPNTNLKPCPDRKITDPENIWMLVLTSLFGLLALYIRERIKNVAKLSDIGKITDKIESVKHEYNNKMEEYKAKLGEELATKVEPLKAMLQKENISYQISLAELTKIRFIKIEELVLNIMELQNFIRKNMFWAENDEQFLKNKNEFNDLYNKVDTLRKICDLYLTNELTLEIINVLNNTHSAYMSFVKMYHTNPKKLGDIPIWDLNSQKIRMDLTNENFQAYEKLNTEIDKFPIVLKKLTDEFKKQITLKNIDDIGHNKNGL